MEGEEGGESRMIPWWVGLICGVVGEIIGMMVIIICMGGKKQSEKEWAEENGLIYKENKKAADAGTSTAAHEARKGYFL